MVHRERPPPPLPAVRELGHLLDHPGLGEDPQVIAGRPGVLAQCLGQGRRGGWPVGVELGTGGFLLPWCVLLATTLPATAQAQHWALAWTTLDAAEAVMALATAVLLARGDSRASLTAMACGALLLTDAWFDVCTSAPGLDHGLA
jgi:hypothetical protein